MIHFPDGHASLVLFIGAAEVKARNIPFAVALHQYTLNSLAPVSHSVVLLLILDAQAREITKSSRKVASNQKDKLMAFG